MVKIFCALHIFYQYIIRNFHIKKKKIISDEVVNLTNEQHGPNVQMNHLRKEENKKDLEEGTGVVPAKCPPKVKLEILSQL